MPTATRAVVREQIYGRTVEDFWAHVSRFADRFRETAPEGMKAVVDVEMIDARTFRPEVVQTDKTGEWLVAEITPASGSESGDWEILFVRQEDVRRVHVRHEPAERAQKQPVGFRVGTIEP